MYVVRETHKTLDTINNMTKEKAIDIMTNAFIALRGTAKNQTKINESREAEALIIDILFTNTTTNSNRQ